MARQKPQRIGEIQVSPTITQTNTFVQASEAIDATGAASYDFSDALLNAAPQVAKAVSAFSDKENKELAEVGYAIASRVNKGEKLEKVVAEYLGSGATPNRLRSQLAKWVENGKITKSANPFFRRSYEEVTNKHRADHAEIEMATRIDELVGAMKAASSAGQSDMIRAGEEILGGYIGDNPQLYEDLSEYGAAQLREMLTERGNKLVGVALARAEDEMTQEKVKGEFDAVTKGFTHTLDVEAQKASRAGDDLDIDAEELFKSTPMHIAFGRQFDNLKDIGDPKLQRDALKNTAMSMMDAVYLNPALSIEDRKELVNYIMDEAGSARTNNGTGPYAISRAGAEMQSVTARAKQILKQLDYSKDNDESDRTSGVEWAMANILDEDWIRKSPEDWTDQDTQRRQEVLQMVSEDYGGGFLQGVLYVEGRERDILSKVRNTSATELEQVEINELEQNAMSLYEYEGGAPPFFGNRDAKLQWGQKDSPSADLFKARMKAISRWEGVVNSEVDKHHGSRVAIVRHALKPEYNIAYEDLGEDALTSAVATVEENKVLEDGWFQNRMLEIDTAMRQGLLKPQQALEARRSAAVQSYRNLPDNPATYETLAQGERKSIDETRQKMSDPDAAGTWVGSGEKYTVNVPDSPLSFLGFRDRRRTGVGLAGKQSPFKAALNSGRLFDDTAEFEFVSENELKRLRENTIAFLEGKTKMYASTRVNINQPGFDTLSKDYFNYIEESGGLSLKGNLNTYLDVLIKERGTIFVDDNGDYRLSPEAIPSLSVLGMPDEIRAPEILMLYPEAAKVGEGSAIAAHAVSRTRLGNRDDFVTGTGDAQKMKIDMTNIVGVDPLVRRAWDTSQRLFSFSQGQEYDERNVSHRRTMSYIWQHVSSNETLRTVKR